MSCWLPRLLGVALGLLDKTSEICLKLLRADDAEEGRAPGFVGPHGVVQKDELGAGLVHATDDVRENRERDGARVVQHKDGLLVQLDPLPAGLCGVFEERLVGPEPAEPELKRLLECGSKTTEEALVRRQAAEERPERGRVNPRVLLVGLGAGPAPRDSKHLEASPLPGHAGRGKNVVARGLLVGRKHLD